MRWLVTQFIVILWLLFPASVFAASLETTVDGETLFARGALFPIGNLEVHISPGTISVETTVDIDELGIPPTRRERSLTSRFRTVDPVYVIDVTPLQDAFMVVRVTPSHETNRRQRLFYRANAVDDWEVLETTFTIDGQLQAIVPFSGGAVVVGTHRYKNVAPVRSATFTPYSGTPYSAAAAVLDVRSGKFLYREHATNQHAIASLTKLVTAFIFLENEPNLDNIVSYHSGNDRGGATVPLNHQDQLSLRDVLMATLIPSANNMAMTLANSIGLTEQEFINRSHQRLRELSIRKTHLDEPTGLDADNVSTAGNIARFARGVFGTYPEIFAFAAEQPTYDITLQNRSEIIRVYSTNKFDGRGLYSVTAFKTGYLPGSAERTLVMQVEEVATGYDIIVVLLGNPEYNTIFDEAYNLVDWTFSNWEFAYSPQ